MKLPAKIEYAYKAVLELALRYKDGSPVQISAICRSHDIPNKFLVQLLLRLKNANIVNSSRGAAGGYYLMRPSSQISLADVFRAVDESILESPRTAKGGKASQTDKLIVKIWGDISKEVVGRLEQITFDKLTAQLKSEQMIYYI